MAIERVTLEKVPSTMKKLIDCLEALGLNPGTFTGGPDTILVFGTRKDLKLAVQVRYLMGTTPKGALSAKFDGAKVIDPIGIVENLEVDYSYNKAELKQYGYLPDWADGIAKSRSAEYNDGAQWLNRLGNFSAAAQLNEWLDDWIEALGVDHKSQTAKKKEKPTDLDLMMGESWTG